MNTKPIILKVPAFEDFRGYLAVPYDKSVDFRICQINQGYSKKAFTLRGLHTLMQWCVDNDFCGEAAKAIRYDSDFVWEGDPWPEADYIISEKDRNAIKLEL